MAECRYLRNIKSVNYSSNYLMWRRWYCNGKLVNYQYIWRFDNNDAKQVCEFKGYGIPWYSYNTHVFVGRCSFVVIEVKSTKYEIWKYLPPSDKHSQLSIGVQFSKYEQRDGIISCHIHKHIRTKDTTQNRGQLSCLE